jgi:tetratricopeptide (TPR) repeat protein
VPAKSDSQQASDNLRAGLSAQIAGRTDEAATDYHKVLDKDPKNKYALYDLGLIDQNAGRTDAAEREYRQALQTDPEFVNALFNLAILRTKADPNEAVTLYQHAIRLQPSWAGAHLNLGFLLKSLGKDPEAQAEFKLAVQYDSSLASRIPPGAGGPAPNASPTK